VEDSKFGNMNLQNFLNLYLLLMLPMVISVNKELRKMGMNQLGIVQGILLFINMIITLPFWYFLFIKELFFKKKK